jgi:hypothetical protein
MLSPWPLFFGLFSAVFVNNLTVTLRCAQPVGESGSMAVTLFEVPSSLSHECQDFCLMFIIRRSRFHLLQQRRSVSGVLVVLLLLLVGVESNPGPTAATLKLGVFNVQSASTRRRCCMTSSLSIALICSLSRKHG